MKLVRPRIECFFGGIKARFPRITSLRFRKEENDAALVVSLLEMWNLTIGNAYQLGRELYDPNVAYPDVRYPLPTLCTRKALSDWRDSIALGLPPL